MASKHTGFWLALLKHGNNEEKRRKNWNRYCIWRYDKDFQKLIAPTSLEKDVPKQLGCRGGWCSDETWHLEELAQKHGGHPELPIDPFFTYSSFMDFSEVVFCEDVSFAGRVLIGAGFRETTFEQRADFSDAIFLGVTHLNEVKFTGTQSGMDGVTSFSGASFHNRVEFNETLFPHMTRFDNAVFHGGASFRLSKFTPGSDRDGNPEGTVMFEQSRFESDADFTETIFNVATRFQNAEFAGKAEFRYAEFCRAVTFNNAKFKDTTSFRNAKFSRPPKFFETKLHEDADFREVDWRSTEQSYSRAHRCNESDNDAAIRAWDRLALIMSQRERLPERHDFYRLKMRALRQRDGRRLLKLANWLFDKSSDYGWGVGRAFFWWAVHIVSMATILSAAVFICPTYYNLGFLEVVWNSILVSFANAHAIFGLASEGGYLHGAREHIVAADGTDWVFNAVGTFQAILGPVLLFLLLTLRNRFRLG